MANERKLQAVLQWAIDKGSLSQVLRALDPLKHDLKEIDDLVAQINKSLTGLGVTKSKGASGLSEIKSAAQGVTQEATKAAAALDKLNQKTQKQTKTPEVKTSTPIKIDVPTISDDLSKTSEIAEILEKKLEEAANQAQETAKAAQTIAQNTAKAVNEAQKLANAQKEFAVNRADYTRPADFDKKLKQLESLTQAQKDAINKLYANDPGTSQNRYQFVEFEKRVDAVAKILDDVQRKQMGIFEITKKVADAEAEVANQAARVTQEAEVQAVQFERIPNNSGMSRAAAEREGNFYSTDMLEAMPKDVRDSQLSQMTEAEQAAFGYRKVVDGITDASSKAERAQAILQEEIKKVAQKSREGTLSLQEYVDLINEIATLSPKGGTVDALKVADRAGIKPPTEVARKFFGYVSETGDNGEDRLKIEYAVEKSLDKQAATLRDQLTEEERIWEVIKRISSTLGLTTRDAAQLLANYKGISKETQAMAAKVGSNPQEVTRAKNYRIAQEAAKFAADATAQNATQEQRLANIVNEVGKRLKMTTSEAAKFVSTMREGSGKSAEELEKLTKKINEAKKAAGGMAGGMRFGIMGFTTQIIGVQIEQFIKPFFQLPNQFAQFAGKSNEAARDWLANTARIEQSQMRIAQTVSKAILPAMEQFAKWLEEAATFAEENPEWVKTLAEGAKILLAAAIALKGIGFTFSAIGTAQNLGAFVAKSTAGRAVGGALTSTGISGVVSAVLPFLPVIIAAVASYLAISKLSLGNLGVKGHDPDTSILDEAKGTYANIMGIAAAGGAAIGTIATNIARGQDALEGVAYNMAEAARGADELTRSVLNFGDGARKASNKLDESGSVNPNIIVPDNIVQGIANLLKQMTDLETQYEEERANLVEQYGQERVDLEDKYEKQRQDLIKNYNDQLADLYASYIDQIQDATENYAKNERRAEEDYYRRRTLAAQEFGKEIERLEEDHQDRLEKMRRDHLFNVEALVASRDALGLAREMRRYEEERQQEEANYEKEVRRKNEDFADKMKQMEEEFALERARRQEDFEDRLREIEENYQRQKAKLAQQQAERLAELERQQEEEKKIMEDNLDEQLKLLEERFAKEKANIEKQIADQILLAESLGLTAQNIQYIYDTAIEYFTRLQTLRNQILSSLNYRGYGGGIPSLGNTGGGAGGGGTTEYYDQGGYITKAGRYGMAMDGKPEFVLANPTVKALERGIGGGSLTQEKVIAMTNKGQSINQTTRIVIDQTNWRIEGGLTVAEKRALMKEVYEATHQAIRGVNAR